jgi:hypothetical protein
MSEDREKKIHANEESGDEVEAHVKKHGRERLDEGGTDKTDDESNDVEAHVKSHRH